ncbi:50S ribosomal protein L5 [Striga asiatica]|uniref:Large ribosomal subunit protein uL5c n=1 Tax=Striga asiatica TaxID=4170 RepID=A0A5A7RJX1_STRAF|nr:50S ribosomal protein L5 [Striga asiatica]
MLIWNLWKARNAWICNKEKWIDKDIVDKAYNEWLEFDNRAEFDAQPIPQHSSSNHSSTEQFSKKVGQTSFFVIALSSLEECVEFQCKVELENKEVYFLSSSENKNSHGESNILNLQLFPPSMAISPAFLHSAASTFDGRFSVRLPSVTFPGGRTRRLSVKATSSIVLVDKTEAEKVSRLKTTYLDKIVPLLKEEFNYTNIHQVPKVEKIVVNCGIGDAAQNAKGLEAAINDLALITGQRPVKTRAKKAIATFKIREGQPLGIACTLRGKVEIMVFHVNLKLHVMYSFLDRLINLGLPRTRDFQGVSPSSFDGNGNYSIGIREQSVFPELGYDLYGKPRGMDVCITTTANTDKEAYKLLALMGMPFREGSVTGTTPVVKKKKFKSHHFVSKSKSKQNTSKKR